MRRLPTACECLWINPTFPDNNVKAQMHQPQPPLFEWKRCRCPIILHSHGQDNNAGEDAQHNSVEISAHSRVNSRKG